MTAVGEFINPRERHDFVALDDPADKVRIKRGGPLGIVQVEQIDPFEPQGLNALLQRAARPCPIEDISGRGRAWWR